MKGSAAPEVRCDEEARRRLDRLSSALDAHPAAFRGNPLNLLFLEAAVPIRSAVEYLRALDGPGLCEERREYLLGDAPEWPFPVFNMKERPDPWCVSEVLFSRFDLARDLLTRQQDVGRILYDLAAKHDPDIIVLMIVDGLSYYDLSDREDAMPCLVEGITTTGFGYREVLGKPSVSQRLFTLGYRHQLGMTYFDTDSNDLAGDLYRVFGNSQIVRITAFQEALGYMRTAKMSRGYVQIAAPGLDGLCHSHQDEPPVGYYLKELLERFDAIIACLKKRRRKVLACLIADHGILWRQHIDGRTIIVGDLLPEDIRSPRYVRGSLMRDYTRVMRCAGQSYSPLRLPYLTRSLKRTEWGVHGGISAWESIVPIVVRNA